MTRSQISYLIKYVLMSHTHKHQLKYLARHWRYSKWEQPYLQEMRDGVLCYIYPPPEPEPQEYPVPSWIDVWNEGRRSKFYRMSYKRLRKKWTRLLHENDEWKIGKESLKPENVDWDIW